MTISLIAAMDNNRVIGNKNSLPWHLPADLQHFKKLTVGKPIIMGSNTFTSIGKALPERLNIVLTHDPAFSAEGCKAVYSIDEAIAATGDAKEIMVIGGATIFTPFLPLANKMYLTIIETSVDGDVYFPQWNPDDWHETSREPHEPDEKNLYHYAFLVLERKANKS